MQFSKVKASPNALQSSNRKPNILQFLNVTFLKAVFAILIRLKLQSVNSQSVN